MVNLCSYRGNNCSLLFACLLTGWMTCDFTSFSTVLRSYQDDWRLIMKGCAVVLCLWLRRFHLKQDLISVLWISRPALPTELLGFLSHWKLSLKAKNK